MKIAELISNIEENSLLLIEDIARAYHGTRGGTGPDPVGLSFTERNGTVALATGRDIQLCLVRK